MKRITHVSGYETKLFNWFCSNVFKYIRVDNYSLYMCVCTQTHARTHI